MSKKLLLAATTAALISSSALANSNYVDLQQNGIDNVSSAVQTGNNNTADPIKQDGERNSADLTQTGNDNFFSNDGSLISNGNYGQTGNDNLQTTYQEGNLNSAILVQYGDWNEAYVDQIGDENESEVDQGYNYGGLSGNGALNIADVDQIGNGTFQTLSSMVAQTTLM